MKLSKKGEYALRALTYLGAPGAPSVVSIQEIARQENIPKKFLEQVLLALKKAGLVQSSRGKAGGYSLHGAQNVLSGGGISVSPGSVSLEFDITIEFPVVTLVSMLAPSPDWFVGVSAQDLMENGNWADSRIIELFPYDAGTDSGATYSSPDEETSPREPISRIDGPPLTVNGAVPAVGTFTFTRIDT